MAKVDTATFSSAPHQPLIISSMAQLVTDEINVTDFPPGKSPAFIKGYIFFHVPTYICDFYVTHRGIRLVKKDIRYVIITEEE